jgi:hypothetical protein
MAGYKIERTSYSQNEEIEITIEGPATIYVKDLNLGVPHADRAYKYSRAADRQLALGRENGNLGGGPAVVCADPQSGVEPISFSGGSMASPRTLIKDCKPALDACLAMVNTTTAICNALTGSVNPCQATTQGYPQWTLCMKQSLEHVNGYLNWLQAVGMNDTMRWSHYASHFDGNKTVVTSDLDYSYVNISAPVVRSRALEHFANET